MVFVNTVIFVAFDDPALVLGGKLTERHVHRNFAHLAELLQIALAFGAHAGAPGFDRALGQRQRAVGNGEFVVNRDRAAKAFASRARAERVVEAEEGRGGVGVFDVALGAVEVVAEALRVEI